MQEDELTWADYIEYGPFEGWQVVNYARGLDGKGRILWHNTSGKDKGKTHLWVLEGDDQPTDWILGGNYHVFLPTHQPDYDASGSDFWLPLCYAQDRDGNGRLFWRKTEGANAGVVRLWVLNGDTIPHRWVASGAGQNFFDYGPYTNPHNRWHPVWHAQGNDGNGRFLWTKEGDPNHGIIRMWVMNGDSMPDQWIGEGPAQNYFDYGPFISSNNSWIPMTLGYDQNSNTGTSDGRILWLRSEKMVRMSVPVPELDTVRLWVLDGDEARDPWPPEFYHDYGPYSGWSAVNYDYTTPMVSAIKNLRACIQEYIV
jgi:hypothetical protein